MSANMLINTSGNRWETPPWGVIQGGWEQVVRYHDELAQSGGVIVTGLKVVLVGAVHAGKTTLARGLLDGDVPETPPPRTRGVDVHVHPWVPDFNPALDMMIWDFAGHDAYSSTHQVSDEIEMFGPLPSRSPCFRHVSDVRTLRGANV